MNILKYGFFYFFETIFRYLPVPHKTGLVKIGSPDENSPVLVTGNYHLTVMKVRRALKGLNLFLLVANSRGINVWCASAGGHFTHHDIISAIKLSDIENLVGHRTIVLPQLAACGIEAKKIHQRTGWRVRWGPVDIRDFPDYLACGLQKKGDMGVVRFPLQSRLEMAASGAFWLSMICSLFIWIIKKGAVVPAIITIWLISFILFCAFPLYLPLLRAKGKEKLWEKRRAGRKIFLSLLFFFVMLGLGSYAFVTSRLTLHFLLFWGALSLVAVFFLGGDLAGNTPLLVSEFREERGYLVQVDSEKCRGDGVCRTVCPLDCFILNEKKRLAIVERPDKCILCGACVVQCQFDALSYSDNKGKRVPPEFIRRHKVGFSGKRKSPKKNRNKSENS